MKKIELLAPARNIEIGISAINSGADAVYISSPLFGARQNAENSIQDIAGLLSYAHKYYARIYITLNTILNDNELSQALNLIKKLYEIGIDALIIQDFGLLELDLPPIPLFASTQTHNDTYNKILFLENAGFKRAILARELTLNEIINIRKKVNIDLECFVHGALCTSYSGQCYLSYAIGGRSANRGKCAQPCRREYSLCDSKNNILIKNNYLLSLKDLNLSGYLKDLINAGITSFKIEGRLKDLTYVTNITSFYRKKLDEIFDGKNITKSSSGKITFSFIPDPNKTFNRGYTDFGINSKIDKIASLKTPKSIGEQIGIVKNAGKDFFKISSDQTLANGDGLCFFDSDSNLRGTTINKVNQNIIFPDKIKYITKGTVIYRNYNKLFIDQLNKNPNIRLIEISLILNEEINGFTLKALDEDGNKAEYSILTDKILAKIINTSSEIITKQLKKFGDTIFVCNDLKINFNNIYFIPISILNSLRRGVIQNLINIREKNFPYQKFEIKMNSIPYPLKTLDYRGNVLNKKASEFYSHHNVIITEPAAESGINMNNKQVMISKYCIKKELDLCKKELSKEGIKEPLYLIDENNHKYLLKFNCKECKMEIYFS